MVGGEGAAGGRVGESGGCVGERQGGGCVHGLGEAGDRGRKEGWRAGEEEPSYRRWWCGGARGAGGLRWGNSNEFLAGGGQVAMKRRRRA